VVWRAGGKGVNVARILLALGAETAVTGLVGGVTGGMLRSDLRTAGLADKLEEITGDSRRTLSVFDEGTAHTAIFNEPGPTVGPREWQRFIDRFIDLVAEAHAVVLSGSLPPGLPVNSYAVLIDVACKLGVPTVLDADGEALRQGLSGHPTLVKPNLVELESFVGRSLRFPNDVVEGIAAMRKAGSETVVASLGPEGLVAVTPEGSWTAKPPESVVGNPTGAGDAAVAALTLGMLAGTPWPQRLADAVALSAAAVCMPVAGAFDAAAYRRFLPAVHVEAR
jgi:tagatose 6-phosphate kinase